MSKLSLVEVHKNKGKFVIDVLNYIRNYKLDLGLQNEEDFKEEFQDALSAFEGKQQVALQLASVKTKLRKMKFNQDI